MKKLIVLILLVLATLTSFSQTTTQDTTTGTSTSKIDLTPLDLNYGGVPYKAFTIPQTKDIIKELRTLEYLVWEDNVKERWIMDLEALNKTHTETISEYRKVVAAKNDLIKTQDLLLENQIKLADTYNKRAKKTALRLKIVSGVSIGVIGWLLFVK